jgi:hypothetical protein
MNRILFPLVLLFFASSAAAQLKEVRFNDATFENGMTYPQLEIAGDPVHQDSINADLRLKLKDLEAAEFCIGQYGYVQKSTHLQIHIFCNCIDFSESVNRYYLYNLEEGRSVPYSDLINPQEKDAATAFLSGKMTEFTAQNDITLSETALSNIQKLNLDGMQVEMTRDGLNIQMRVDEGWDATKILKVSWVELKSFLKYHFI